MTLQYGELNGIPIFESSSATGVPIDNVDSYAGNVIARLASHVASSKSPFVLNTVSDMKLLTGKKLINGQTYKTLGHSFIGDMPNYWIYNNSGRSGLSNKKPLDFINASGSDDYFYRLDKSTRVLPQPELTDVGIFVNPGAETLASTLPIEVQMIVGGKGIVVELQQTNSGSQVCRAINLISEGDAKAGWYGPENGDTLFGVASKATAGGVNYYVIDSTDYVEYNYNGSIPLDNIVVRVYSVAGSSATGEIVRNRGGDLTVLAEFNSDTGTTNAFADVYAVLSDTVINGDAIRIRMKSGESNSVRLQWILGYNNSINPTSHSDFVIINKAAITVEGSSIEWATSCAPIGQSSVWVGNKAHQDKDEVNYSEKWLLDGQEITPLTKGYRRGKLEILRQADIDFGSWQIFMGYQMRTAFTVSGIYCRHYIEFYEDSFITNFYPVMFPALPSYSSAIAGYETLTLDVSDNNSLYTNGWYSEVIMGDTPAGDTVKVKLSEAMQVFVWRQTSYDKLYFRLIGSSTNFSKGDSFDYSWLIEL